MDTHVVTDRICTNYFAIWSSACAPCNDDHDDDDEIMMNSSCYYITATIITFIIIFLSSLTMTVAINRSPLSLSMKTKCCYNIRQFYYEAQQKTHPFLLDIKRRLVHTQDLRHKKSEN